MGDVVETRAAFYQIAIGRAPDGLERVDRVLAETQNYLTARDEIVLGAPIRSRLVAAKPGALRRGARRNRRRRPDPGRSPRRPPSRYADHPTPAGQCAPSPRGATARRSPKSTPSPRSRPKSKAPATPTRWAPDTSGPVCSKHLGRYGEALAEIDAFAPIQAEVQGARHPDTLSTRHLRAGVLQDLGRYGEALAEIDAFAPIQAEVNGAAPPPYADYPTLVGRCAPRPRSLRRGAR